MIPYVETEFFSKEEMALYHKACWLVHQIPDDFPQEIRCHELAQAVGRILDLPYVDGFYGCVNHTWLWTRHPTHEEIGFLDRGGWTHDNRPRILDVYFPGVIPQVVLIDTFNMLPQWKLYNSGPYRDDIDNELVERMVRLMDVENPFRISTHSV
jgi:hypothetical protein